MNQLESILSHGIPFLMVLARITGIFLFTPILTSASIPRVFKAMLAFAFSIAIYPFVPVEEMPDSYELISLAPILFAELLIGIAIGLIAGIPMVAMQMGGYLMGYQMGLSLAESYNPELDTNSSVIGQLLFYLSIFLYITVGGFETIFILLADSFHTIQTGSMSTYEIPLDLLLSVLSSGFDLALRVGSPILAVISMLLIAMGFIMKTMPQINIMSIGFSIQIIAGLTILSLTMVAIASVVGDEMIEVLSQINTWIQSYGRTQLSGVSVISQISEVRYG